VIPNGNQRTDVVCSRDSSLLKKPLENKALSKYIPKFRAQGDGFTVFMPTDSSKLLNLT